MTNPYKNRFGAILMRIRPGILLAALLVLATGCDLDLSNPNAPTEEEVLTDENGVIALAVGMQDQYASSLDTYILGSALVTDEWGLKAAALLCDEIMFTGEGLDFLPACGNVSNPYFVTYRVIRSANLLIANAPQIDRLSPGTQTGLIALAKLFKAMALGSAILNFESVAVDADPAGTIPQPREAVLDTIVGLLQSAQADLGSVSDVDLATVYDRAVGEGLDLRNTVNAMLARYALVAGDYQLAIDAAAQVDPSVLSLFTFPAPGINPLYDYSIAANYTTPLHSVAEEAEPGDLRPSYWLNPDSTFAGQPDSILSPPVKYSQREDPIPVYLPDEMKLIRAEAHTRLGDFPAARALINEVRTQCSSGLDEPVACLPALPDAALDSEAELLSQIAYERRYELFLQGLRWDDMRRLDDAIAREPVIEFLPFPLTECQQNPNPIPQCPQEGEG